MAQQFQLVSDYQPTGDQPAAIEGLVQGVKDGHRHQTLLGATGTGKTYTVANLVQQLQRPTLVLAHNKTLAAQLYAEFKEFFPKNAVEYYVSYYDYYQPESYVPRYDLYIEKQTQINDHIERLRVAAKAALLSRSDVLIVASVSCIYGTGDPETWGKYILELRVGDSMRREAILRRLVQLQYSRNDMDLAPGSFRVRGDTLEIHPFYEDAAYRIQMFDDDIERILRFDPLTGELLADQPVVVVFPATQFVADQDKLRAGINQIEEELEQQVRFFKDQGKLVEAQRLEQRTRYDLEMLREVGFTGGIENYSRHLENRPPGSPPHTLVDYFPDDFLLVIDESHMTMPQIRGMYNGDQARKQVLVDYGFRLPSAMDNRPLQLQEFEARMGYTIYTTATPAVYEKTHSTNVVQQIIRPTGILDPLVEVRPVAGQIDDILQEVAARVKKGQRALITTFTQRMSEELAGYFNETGIKAHYLHAEVETLERVEILRDLRMGVYDVIVGINLLREGIDLPEVSLVCILDADKEGFLRSASALIQTIGRAARHIEGKVILYGNVMTDSMKAAISETERRRAIQDAHNKARGITPVSIVKQIRDLTDRVRIMAADESGQSLAMEKPDMGAMAKAELHKLAKELEREMKTASLNLEFEKAAALRDQLFELRGMLALKDSDDLILAGEHPEKRAAGETRRRGR
ncbi:MAG: excinuclease ABC subunit UvrB [Anaerolineae bacterium]|nr:excinuclease ABC subunit UvrB [Chloroflexota bacterium]MBP6297842.1 excinuclease ABC subunit UvrB [Anaerolineae bacterium]